MSHAIDRAVVVALGNRYRSDDGVGHAVAEQLIQRQVPCRVVANQDDSMALLNAWESAELAIIVDAADCQSAAGTIHRLQLDQKPLPKALARCSSHGVGLAEALELGKILDRLPQNLVIYAIEAEHFNPGICLSPGVSEAVIDVVQRIEQDLAEYTTGNSRDDIHLTNLVE